MDCKLRECLFYASPQFFGCFYQYVLWEFVSRCGHFSDGMIPEDQASQWSENEPSKWLSIKQEEKMKQKKKKVWQKVLQIALEISRKNSKLKSSRATSECWLWDFVFFTHIRTFTNCSFTFLLVYLFARKIDQLIINNEGNGSLKAIKLKKKKH